SGTGTTAGTGTTSGSGTGSGSGSGSGTGGGSSSGGSSSGSAGGHTVTLVQIFTKAGKKEAQVRVDDTVYDVAPGQVFAQSFEVVSINGNCATMLFGDEQFSLCQGQEILK